MGIFEEKQTEPSVRDLVERAFGSHVRDIRILDCPSSVEVLSSRGRIFQMDLTGTDISFYRTDKEDSDYYYNKVSKFAIAYEKAFLPKDQKVTIIPKKDSYKQDP